jgi:hypothetical protein
MTGERRIVSEGGVVTYDTIMGDMDIGHDPVIVTETGNPPSLHGASINGTVLTNGIAIPYLEAGLCAFTLIFLILRIIADRTKLIDLILPANSGRATDHHLGTDPGALPDLDIRSNERPRTYTDPSADRGLWMNNSAWVNQRSITA